MKTLRAKEDGHTNAEVGKRERTGKRGKLESIGNSRSIKSVERKDEIARVVRESNIGGGTKHALYDAPLCGTHNGCRETIAVRQHTNRAQ